MRKSRFPLYALMAAAILSSCARAPIAIRGSASVKAYFSPDGGAKDAVVRLIDASKNSVDVAMYSFTSRPISNALVNAMARGVKIRVVLDRSQSDGRFSKYAFLLNHGISPRLATGIGYGIMHDKFAIFDGNTLATGSFNWTASAEKYNHENMLVITGAPRLTVLYQKEFDYLYGQGR